jgi:hypothetical protein
MPCSWVPLGCSMSSSVSFSSSLGWTSGSWPTWNNLGQPRRPASVLAHFVRFCRPVSFHLSYAQWGSGIRMWCCIQSSHPAMDFVPISSLLCSLVTQAVSKGLQRSPKVSKAYLQALLNGGYGYDVIKFGNSLFLHACIKLDDAVSILHLFTLGLPSDVLPCPFLPVNDASTCSPSECNNNSCCFNKCFARWSHRRSTWLSLKHIIATVTCWLIVAFRNRTFFLLSLTPPKTFKFYYSVCNILVGIHLSWCVDGLDSGRVLLHPNPVFCQSSHECMSQSGCDVLWPNRGNNSWDSNISTLKDLLINKCIMVLWSRQDKTTKQH